MTSFIIRRLLQGAVVLVLSSVIIYFLLTLIPGGPLSGLMQCGNCRISKTDVYRLGYLMGLNDPKGVPYPWYERYFRWVFSPGKEGGIDVKVGDVEIKGAGLITGVGPRPIVNPVGGVAIFLDLNDQVPAADRMQSPARDEEAVARLDREARDEVRDRAVVERLLEVVRPNARPQPG